MRSAPPSERTMPRSVSGALRAQIPRMTLLMERAILDEVPRYQADPDRYREDILQLCRLAVRIFLGIVESGQPSGRREVAVVQRVGMNVARADEPLEPLLHALRIGARVGWQETLLVSEATGDAPAEKMLQMAGQVFEYIDQLSSHIAEAYSQQVEQSARARALSESALFEDIVAGRTVQPDSTQVARPRLALAVAGGGADRASQQRAAGATGGRLRARLPNSIVGQRNGLTVWLLPRDPLPQLLTDCAAGEQVAFGISQVSEDVPLSRAVDEAVEAAYLGLELDSGEGPAVIDFRSHHAYTALRADPGALARYQQAVLGPLLDRPALLETLREYFLTGRSLSATAARVHRHRQSVVYRLRRIQGTLGIRLDDAEAMFRLEAAIRTLPR